MVNKNKNPILSIGKGLLKIRNIRKLLTLLYIKNLESEVLLYWTMKYFDIQTILLTSSLSILGLQIKGSSLTDL